jgi:hypothetical protein
MNLIRLKPDGTYDEIQTPHFSLVDVLRNWPNDLGDVPNRDDGQLLMLQADNQIVIEMMCTVNTFFHHSDVVLGVMLTGTLLCFSFERNFVYWRLRRLGRDQESKLFLL